MAFIFAGIVFLVTLGLTFLALAAREFGNSGGLSAAGIFISGTLLALAVAASHWLSVSLFALW